MFGCIAFKRSDLCTRSECPQSALRVALLHLQKPRLISQVDWTSRVKEAVVLRRSHVFAGVARISGLCSVAGPNRILRLKQEIHMTIQSTQMEPEQVFVVKRPAGAKGPSKKTQLIKLLSRKSGANAVEISAKFGWLPHTTRAALSGLRKAGYEITTVKTGKGKPARYQIIGLPQADAA